jgi:predicted nucleic acid-binding protein
MIVIADNSPLSALAEIGQLEILKRLYGRIVIPDSVAREAIHPNAPEALRDWIASQPAWLDRVPDPTNILLETSSLGAGEASAISLAWNHRTNALILLDDRAARRLADAMGLRITGVGGILLAAARLGMLDFEDSLARLQQTSFRLGDAIVKDLRRRWRDGR